ncbi:NAD(P)H-dependent flavin oxidoreductase [Vreelandella rituensis]|uniref:Nitronate monooxygenase n=1 Tax=Vreelandella rituensis TaxID=2282306 RepID=A0A368TVW4_9GAMM|nr:nitronate monooxygenase [Halomonas rituensis]RCV88102.1 nitronate monooxygenase [Halomonas rituensis]
MADKHFLLKFGIEHPIVQAPMAGVSTPELAAAVSNAGALGSIGLGASSVSGAREMIKNTHKLTTQPFNVNLFCHQPAKIDKEAEAAWLRHLSPFFSEMQAQPPAELSEIYQTLIDNEEMLDMLLEEKPPVVSFHFGLPSQGFIDALKAQGILLLSCATTLEEAQQAEAAGIDAIVAQGMEAGGHRGAFSADNDEQMGTLPLTRLLASHVSLPIIAAGGIMDGASINAALTLGASAVQMGTAFILCPESSANSAYREELKSPRAHHTQITAVISGRPARGIINRMHTDVAQCDGVTLPDYPIAYDAAKSLNAAAMTKGHSDFAAHWAGQGAPLARELLAEELIRTLLAEMQR